jgi:hypothetical protein
VQKGGLATAAGAHHGNEFAFLNLDANMIQGSDGSGARSVDLGQIFSLDE